MAGQPTRQAALFDLTAGALCLDFANTVCNRGRGDETERLADYRLLLAWAEQAGLLDSPRADALARRAALRPRAGAAALKRALTLREALFGVFSAVAAGRDPHPMDLQPFNDFLVRAVPHLRLSHASGGARWSWSGAAESLEGFLWPVAWSAAELLTSCDLERVRECGAEDCRWLFVDASRNHSRRWCDMKTCGNRAKARRHYRRRREDAVD